MGRSTPESEEIQNLAKSPFAQGEAGSDRGWDITTLDNQFPRPQDISLADIPEALGRIIIVEHAVREILKDDRSNYDGVGQRLLIMLYVNLKLVILLL